MLANIMDGSSLCRTAVRVAVAATVPRFARLAYLQWAINFLPTLPPFPQCSGKRVQRFTPSRCFVATA